MYAINRNSLRSPLLIEGQKLPESGFVPYINKQFVIRLDRSTFSKMALASRKVFAIGFSILGKYPSLAPALNLAGDDNVLATRFLSGAAAAMAVEAWSLDMLLQRTFAERSLEEKKITKIEMNRVRKSAQWAFISFFAFLSEVPGSYVSYFYNNKKSVWLFAHFFTHLPRPMVSLDRLIQRVSRTAFCTLCSSSLPGDDCKELYENKQNFVKAIDNVLKKLLEMTPEEREQKLPTLYDWPTTPDNVDSALSLLEEIQALSEEVSQTMEEDTKVISFARKFGAGFGMGTSAFAYILHGYLMYELTDEYISKNPYVQSGIIAATLFPKMFLSFENVNKVFSSGSERITRLFIQQDTQVSSISAQAYPWSTKGLQVLACTASAFSVAPVIKVVADRFDMGGILGKAVMGGCVVTSFSNCMRSMTDFIDQSLGYITLHRGSPHQKEVLDLSERLGRLKELVLNSSDQQFRRLLSLKKGKRSTRYGSFSRI